MTKYLTACLLVLFALIGYTQTSLNISDTTNSLLIGARPSTINVSCTYGLKYTKFIDTNEVFSVDSIAFFVHSQSNLVATDLVLKSHSDFYPQITKELTAAASVYDTIATLDTLAFEPGWNWIKVEHCELVYSEYFSIQLSFKTGNNGYARIGQNSVQDSDSRASVFVRPEGLEYWPSRTFPDYPISLKFRRKQSVDLKRDRVFLSDDFSSDSTLCISNYSAGYDLVLFDFGDGNSQDITKKESFCHQYSDTGKYVVTVHLITNLDTIERIDTHYVTNQNHVSTFPCIANCDLSVEDGNLVVLDDNFILCRNGRIQSWEIGNAGLVKIFARLSSNDSYDFLRLFIDTNRNGQFETNELFYKNKVNLGIVDSFNLSLHRQGKYIASLILSKAEEGICGTGSHLIQNLELEFKHTSHAAPKARLSVSERMDGRILVKDLSSGLIEKRTWKINGLKHLSSESDIVLDGARYRDSLQIELSIENSYGKDSLIKFYQVLQNALIDFGISKVFYADDQIEISPHTILLNYELIRPNQILKDQSSPHSIKVRNGNPVIPSIFTEVDLQHAIYVDFNSDSIFTQDECITKGVGPGRSNFETLRYYFVGLDSFKILDATHFILKSEPGLNINDPSTYSSFLVSRMPFKFQFYALDANPVMRFKYKSPLICDGEFLSRSEARNISVAPKWILDERDTIIGISAVWNSLDTGVHKVQFIGQNYFQTNDTTFYFRVQEQCDTFKMISNQRTRINACNGIVVDEGGITGPTDQSNFMSFLTFLYPQPEVTYDVGFNSVALNSIQPNAAIMAYDSDSNPSRSISSSFLDDIVPPVLRSVTDSLEIQYSGRGFSEEGYVLSFACFFDHQTNTDYVIPPSNNSFQIYPNPAENYMHIAGDLQKIESISLQNYLGQTIEMPVLPLIKLSDFAPGSYIVNIESRGKIEYHKLQID